MKFNVLALSALLFSNSLWAVDATKEELAAAISNFLPDVEVDNIQPSPIEGLYQVIIGAEVVYITQDGSYVIKGEILDINKRRNLTEDLRSDSRVKLLSDLKKTNILSFLERMRETLFMFLPMLIVVIAENSIRMCRN